MRAFPRALLGACGLSLLWCGGTTTVTSSFLDGGPKTDAGSSATSSTTVATSETTSGASNSRSESTSSSSSASTSSVSGADAGVLTGSIVFDQCIAGTKCGETGSFSFSAEFNVLADCTSSTSGGCTLSSCVMSPASADRAGTLSLSGGSLPPGTTVADFGNGVYSDSLIGTLFDSGQSMSISATGAMVPAFGPSSVTAPPRIVLTAPSISDSGMSVISRSSDLTVSWTGGQAGSRVVFEAAGSGSLMSLSCGWDAALGHATVPHALLGQLAAGDAYVEYGQQSTNTFAAGAYSVTESARLYSSETVELQ